MYMNPKWKRGAAKVFASKVGPEKTCENASGYRECHGRVKPMIDGSVVLDRM